jgi:hypothetical protein
VIKQVMGLRPFLHRGREKVRMEWWWACTAFHLRKLIKEKGMLRAAIRFEPVGRLARELRGWKNGSAELGRLVRPGTTDRSGGWTPVSSNDDAAKAATGLDILAPRRRVNRQALKRWAKLNHP